MIPVDELAAATGIDPWFLSQMAEVSDARMALDLQVTLGVTVDDLDRRAWRRVKRLGFSDQQLAYLFGPPVTAAAIRAARTAHGVEVTFKTVDTCGAEFEAHTPYHYSSIEDEDEVRPSDRPRVVILGSGPNRIGQGIEFDYCCVHASLALREAGYETVMVNCNPETVSTDYDTSDRLYFEPLTPDDLAAVLDAEQRASVGAGRLVGVIVSLGGQTPLKLAACSLPTWCWGRTRPPSTWPRTASSGTSCARGWASPNRRGERPPHRPRRWRWPPRSAIPSWCGRPMSSAVGPWRSSTTTSGWWRRWRPCPGWAGRWDARAG